METSNEPMENEKSSSSSSFSEDSSEEEFSVYDGLGRPVDLEPNSRKVTSKVPLMKRLY